VSSVAEFITGTVNESLKKLLQPVGLIPAAVFVLLNVAFIYPVARADGVPIATTFDSLDVPTQAAIIALLTLALGYVLLSASSIILDILGGELIRGSVAHSVLVALQRLRRRQLKHSASGNTWYLSKRFDVADDDVEESDPLPSALGNVLRATQGTVRRRYGLDMATQWSQLIATPELKDLPAKTIVEEERAARDTLANTAFMLWLFALEGLVFFTFQDMPEDALMSLIAVPAGYAVYLFAVAKARAWGSAVETLVDLHRDKLHEALRLAPYDSLTSERQLWESAGRFFVDPAEETGEDVFRRDAAPSLTALPAGELAIPDPVSAVLDGRSLGAGGVRLRWIEYVVLVAKRSDAANVPTARVLIDDPRVARIGPIATLGDTPEPQSVHGPGGRQQLLWALDNLPPGGAAALRYELPLFVLRFRRDGETRAEARATEADAEAVDHLAGAGFPVVVPDGVTELLLDCFAAAEERPELRAADVPLLPSSVDDSGYAWRVTADGDPLWVVLPSGGGR
jgi:hypothetical protein